MGPYFGQEKLERVVGLILEQKPDLVFITGDFLVRGEDHRRALADLSAPLGELARRAAVFSVLGNHDFHRSHYFALRSLLYELGISDVTNKIQSYMQKGDILYIVGVGTFSTGDMQLYQVASQDAERVSRCSAGS